MQEFDPSYLLSLSHILNESLGVDAQVEYYAGKLFTEIQQIAFDTNYWYVSNDYPDCYEFVLKDYEANFGKELTNRKCLINLNFHFFTKKEDYEKHTDEEKGQFLPDKDKDTLSFIINFYINDLLGSSLYNKVIHEIEHWYQKNVRGIEMVDSLYKRAYRGLWDANKIIAILANAIYIARKFEETTYTTEIYGIQAKRGYKTPDELYYDEEVQYLINALEVAIETIKKIGPQDKSLKTVSLSRFKVSPSFILVKAQKALKEMRNNVGRVFTRWLDIQKQHMKRQQQA